MGGVVPSSRRCQAVGSANLARGLRRGCEGFSGDEFMRAAPGEKPQRVDLRVWKGLAEAEWGLPRLEAMKD